MTVSETRDQLGQRVDAAHYRGDVTLITKNGQVRAVLIPYDLYASQSRSRSDDD